MISEGDGSLHISLLVDQLIVPSWSSDCTEGGEGGEGGDGGDYDDLGARDESLWISFFSFCGF